MKFYSLEWISEVLKEYKRETPFFVEEKEVAFSEGHFIFALLHLFKKGFFSEKELSRLTGLSKKELEKQKAEFDFMYLVDVLRKEFAFWIRELILSRDFSPVEYGVLAGEFHLFEEQLRKQIQIPLLDKLKKLVLDVEETLEKKEEVKPEVSKPFKRLVLFFSAVEGLKSSKCEKLVKRAVELYKKVYGNNLLPELPEEEKILSELKSSLSKVQFNLEAENGS